jgi:hypothetical protein
MESCRRHSAISNCSLFGVLAAAAGLLRGNIASLMLARNAIRESDASFPRGQIPERLTDQVGC